MFNKYEKANKKRKRNLCISFNNKDLLVKPNELIAKIDYITFNNNQNIENAFSVQEYNERICTMEK